MEVLRTLSGPGAREPFPIQAVTPPDAFGDATSRDAPARRPRGAGSRSRRGGEAHKAALARRDNRGALSGK
ncbi:hypothetical protein GCM10010415_25460 [Streptomyces atrovirens]